MTTATEPLPPANPARPARPDTVADLLHRLGDVPPDRVRLNPPPGRATLEDLVRVNEEHNGPVCEWVENTLVEKAMGLNESWLAVIVIGRLDAYLQNHDIGMLTAPDGVMKILPGIGRAPDVSFLSWNSLPGGKPPPRSDRVPAVVPELVVEVLSASNTPREMARKRDEYFRAGVKVVWEIDPESRTANVFTGPETSAPVAANGVLDGGAILPGFSLSLREVFDRAERR
jgi:Uma2 family endonuclease